VKGYVEISASSIVAALKRVVFPTLVFPIIAMVIKEESLWIYRFH